ncbi:MAG: D-glycero-beta-D-manno-heptose-7-phosphate kinase [Gemmatimonadetes bacterium]|nr:D-glycero-beta-D-manno-heptose-7-phosphate kinase [Gemmatimonadota bacterium]
MDRLTPERLDEILERAAGVRVLVVGDVMLDIYLRGTASRISPEAPVPVVKVLEEWRALGGAANVATNIVALGASCDLVGCLGRDRAGEEVRRELAALGIGGQGLYVNESRPTTTKTRVMAKHQQVARYDREAEDDVSGDCSAGLAASIEAVAAGAGAIVLEDYNKGVLVPPVIDAALDAGRRFGRPVIVDPKARYFFDYRGATVFKPNFSELAAALRAPVLVEDPEWMERTRRHLDCGHLLVTLGEDGMALVTEDEEYVRIPAVARSVYDVSGAGDTVTAVVAVALAAGASAVEAAILANHAAAVEVSKAGVAIVSPDELRDTVRQFHAARQYHGA